MKAIFEYFNFRCYLADYYAHQKANHKHFSYRYFSNKIGYKSKDFIYRVINKEWPISESSAGKIAQAIGLDEKETEYFEYLVRFNQGKTAAEKNKHFKRLLQFKEKSSVTYKAKQLQAHQYDFFSKWYIPVVFNLLSIIEFRGKFPELAKLVKPKISAKEARGAVNTLVALGLAKCDEDGLYFLTDESISTGNELSSMGLLNFYLKGTELAGEAIANLPRDERHVSGVTVSVSKKTYLDLAEKINTVRQELAKMADNCTDPDRVYQLNFQMIPLSSSVNKKRVK